MFQKVTIHENEYEKIKTTGQNKPNWARNDSNSFSFITFTSKQPNIEIARKRLEEIGLSFEKLDEKYKDVIESIICIIDTEGKTLWMNGFLKKFLYKDKKDVYMQDFSLPRGYNLPIGQKPPDNYPKMFELNKSCTTSKGDFTLKLVYVKFHYLMLGKDE